jgi:hypothetical protein
MKTAFHIVIFTVLFLITSTVKGQIPDTIYIESYNSESSVVLGLLQSSGTSDATISSDYYILYEGTYYPNIEQTVISPIDRRFTTQQVVDYLVKLIETVESKIWYNQATALKNLDVNEIYPTVNRLLDSLGSSGYYAVMADKYGSNFDGIWQVDVGDVSYYLDFTETGVVTEVDSSFVPLPQKSAGAYLIKTLGRFVLTNIEGLPTPITFTKSLDSSFYYNETKTIKIQKLL